MLFVRRSCVFTASADEVDLTTAKSICPIASGMASAHLLTFKAVLPAGDATYDSASTSYDARCWQRCCFACHSVTRIDGLCLPLARALCRAGTCRTSRTR